LKAKRLKLNQIQTEHVPIVKVRCTHDVVKLRRDIGLTYLVKTMDYSKEVEELIIWFKLLDWWRKERPRQGNSQPKDTAI
jgi:hypothetical protein